MSNEDYQHIHHIISNKPLPLYDPHQTTHALHYTQTIDEPPVRISTTYLLSFSESSLVFLS